MSLIIVGAATHFNTIKKNRLCYIGITVFILSPIYNRKSYIQNYNTLPGYPKRNLILSKKKFLKSLNIKHYIRVIRKINFI